MNEELYEKMNEQQRAGYKARCDASDTAESRARRSQWVWGIAVGAALLVGLSLADHVWPTDGVDEPVRCHQSQGGLDCY